MDTERKRRRKVKLETWYIYKKSNKQTNRRQTSFVLISFLFRFVFCLTPSSAIINAFVILHLPFCRRSAETHRPVHVHVHARRDYCSPCVISWRWVTGYDCNSYAATVRRPRPPTRLLRASRFPADVAHPAPGRGPTPLPTSCGFHYSFRCCRPTIDASRARAPVPFDPCCCRAQARVSACANHRRPGGRRPWRGSGSCGCCYYCY